MRGSAMGLAPPGFADRVRDASVPEHAQPFEAQRRPGAVAQEPLAPFTITRRHDDTGMHVEPSRVATASVRSTSSPQESMRQDSALQILAQLLLHVVGNPALVFLARLSEKRLEMLCDDAVEDSVFWLVTLVGAGASPGERSGWKAHDVGGEPEPCRTILPAAC